MLLLPFRCSVCLCASVDLFLLRAWNIFNLKDISVHCTLSETKKNHGNDFALLHECSVK